MDVKGTNLLKYYALFFWCCCCCCFVAQGTYVDDEKNLRTAILGPSYDPSIRPNETVDITLHIAPLSLNYMDIGNQNMAFTIIFGVFWTDYRLQWTPSSYGNINNLVEPTESIWTPYLIVENSAVGMSSLPKTDDNRLPVRIHHSGLVVWLLMLHTKTVCEMTISNFPFDTQECPIALTSWGYDSSMATVLMGEQDLRYYVENGEWDMRSTSVTTGSFDEATGSFSFNRVFYTFSFRRRWPFYGQNLVMPIVLTSILMCTVFALPIDTGEKMGYCLTVLLSYIVFLTWITDNLPAVSLDVSVIQVYLTIVLCLGVLATLLTIWVLILHHRSQSVPMSRPMRAFVNKILIPLQDCTCCKNPSSDDFIEDNEPDDHEESTEPKQNSPNGVPPFGIKRSSAVTPFEERKDNSRLFTPKKTTVTEVTMQPKVTWQEVAVMLDRLFLIVFLVTIILLSSIILAVLYIRY